MNNQENQFNQLMSGIGLGTAEERKQARIEMILAKTQTNWSVVKLPCQTIPVQREVKYFNHETDTQESQMINRPIPLTKPVGADEHGEGGVVRGVFAMMREDNWTHLGTGTEQYTIVQNREVAEICDAIVQANPEMNLSVEAKVIDDGRKVQYRIKLKDVVIQERTNVPDNKIFRYITITNSHDGSSSMKFGIYHEVCVCSNGMYVDKMLKVASLKHTPSIEKRIKEATDKFQIVVQKELEMLESYKKMAKIDMNRTIVAEVVNKVFKPKRPVALKTTATSMFKIVGGYDEKGVEVTEIPDGMSPKMYNSINKFLSADVIGKEIADQGNTLWGLLNAVTRYTNHHMSTTGDRGVLVGEAQTKNEVAYNTISKYADDVMMYADMNVNLN